MRISPFRSLVHPSVNDHWVAYQHWRRWLRNTRQEEPQVCFRGLGRTPLEAVAAVVSSSLDAGGGAIGGTDAGAGIDAEADWSGLEEVFG